MFAIRCPPASGAYIIRTDTGATIRDAPRFLYFLEKLSLSHRLYAETTPEFEQWVADYEIGPMTISLDPQTGTTFTLTSDRDAMLFKLRWL